MKFYTIACSTWWKLLFYICSHCFGEWGRAVTGDDNIYGIEFKCTSNSTCFTITWSDCPRVAWGKQIWVWVLHIYRTFEVEATKFLQNGYHDSELGNTMPLAIANALKISFVVFTSFYFTRILCYSTWALNWSFIFSLCILWARPLWFFTGEIATVKVKCRCGVNTYQHDQENQVACSHQGGRHSSCKCLAAGIACSSSCGCKGCSNPNGVRPRNLGKRKQEQTLWQTLTVSNKKFAADRGEVLVLGVRSDFENMVFFLFIMIHWIKPTGLQYFFIGYYF